MEIIFAFNLLSMFLKNCTHILFYVR